MKTFLWTSLFRILLAIAWILFLGFGNLWTQVLDNARLVKFLPKNVQTQACDPVVSSTLSSIDRCSAAQEHNCIIPDESAEAEHIETTTVDNSVQTILDNVLANQEIIYNQMTESFNIVLQNISTLAKIYTSWTPTDIVDEKEQQRQAIQAQIEALQQQMSSL